ncbi:MAG: GNAT family N-acetyltransferase [Geminocystis sp.]|nr:GNAT family N-acetyltransferase [Geminocystis sp.]HIK36881.1 GNAT family N-acetyltransferase [Geminocystis sp. M7585_C2015_104]MCS7148525.1 GNAT family N-acetyltransferase [Geminocystis sp.]MCX8079481.1 GNAT family N-acetyltransferase [Geminocystis sp.]MDW8114902.1 GNAT family N-acetyltransferase [Geminocystis sp.]
MNNNAQPRSTLVIRPIQYRDLNPVASLLTTHLAEEYDPRKYNLLKKIEQYHSCYGLLQLARIIPWLEDKDFHVYVAEKDGQIQGLIQVAPVNYSRSTWKVEQVVINSKTPLNHILIGSCSVGSQLLRYCFEKIWEARTWIIEVDINEKNRIGLYRENGFQPLAQITYWECDSQLLKRLAQQEPNLPNLLPVSNADAKLIYQLDCVSLPPVLRQVFDRHIEDFKKSFWQYLTEKIRGWLDQTDNVSAYVFEPQRKAAIGHFQLQICKNGRQPHQAQLLVHPAYTWLYPKLLTQMAILVEKFPSQSLLLSSADYQTEREEFLEKMRAQRKQHNLLMSRSVWHKLRETRAHDFSLSEVLGSLKPVQNPIPTPWGKSHWENANPSDSHKTPPREDNNNTV